MPTVKGVGSVQLHAMGCRLTFLKGSTQALLELEVADEDIEVALRFYGRSEKTPDEYIAWVFDLRGQARQPPSRFTDGQLSVVYTALEIQTAVAEVSFHYVPPADGSAMYFRAVEFDYAGQTLDMRKNIDQFPFLAYPDVTSYVACTEFALEVVSQHVDGMLHPSARKMDGTCLPIFTRHSIRSTQVKNHYRLSHDGVSWHHRPL